LIAIAQPVPASPGPAEPLKPQLDRVISRIQPRPAYDYAPAPAGLIDRAQRIRTVCARYGVPIGAAAIRFVLRHPAVTAVVVGARNVMEVTENVSYLAAAVPSELFGELAAERLIPEGS